MRLCVCVCVCVRVCVCLFGCMDMCVVCAGNFSLRIKDCVKDPSKFLELTDKTVLQKATDELKVCFYTLVLNENKKATSV